MSQSKSELVHIKTFASFVGVHHQIHAYSCISVHSAWLDYEYFLKLLSYRNSRNYYIRTIFRTFLPNDGQNRTVYCSKSSLFYVTYFHLCTDAYQQYLLTILMILLISNIILCITNLILFSMKNVITDNVFDETFTTCFF